MNDVAIRQLKKLSKLMGDPCNSCEKITKVESSSRCCDSIFCGITERGLKRLGVHYEKTENKDVPYLGKKGCVIPPEHRPFCTMFACPQVKETSRKFKREYIRLEGKLKRSRYVLDSLDAPKESMDAISKELSKLINGK